MAEQDKKKGPSPLTAFLLVIIIVITTPLAAFSALYFLSEDFQLFSNAILSNVPGPIGSYFNSLPTRADIVTKVREVAEYFLSLPEERAIDKMKVLQKDDSVAYDEVLKEMVRLNPNKTRSILETIRAQGNSNDALSSQLNERENEKQQHINDLAEYLTNLPLINAVEEARNIATGNVTGHEELAQVFEIMDSERVADIIFALESTDKNRILALLSNKKHREIVSIKALREQHLAELSQKASVLKQKSSASLSAEIEGYSIDDLAVILRLFGAKKAGSVLAKVPNNNLVLDVVAKISENEIKSTGRDVFTPDLMLAIKVYKEYDDNLNELVKVYSKMKTPNVANITRTMLVNQSPSKLYQLSSGEDILISDEELIIDILRNFTTAKRGEVLAALDPVLSSEITRKLALPER